MERLLQINEEVRSKRTGRILKCYSIMNVYIGQENRLHDIEYSMWDVWKQKVKSYRQKQLEQLLKAEWQKIIKTDE